MKEAKSEARNAIALPTSAAAAAPQRYIAEIIFEHFR
jgi:hypothetical protein